MPEQKQHLLTIKECLVKKLLLIRSDSLGDHVLFTSALPHIREKFKEWEITVACIESVKPLYDHCPFVDDVIALNRDYRKDYDLAINSVYSRTLLSDSLTFEAGAKETIAFRGDQQNIPPDKIGLWENNNKRYSKLIHIPLDHNCREVDKYTYLLSELGIIANDLQPQLWPQLWPDLFLEPGGDSERDSIVIFCSGGWIYKNVLNIGRALNPFITDNTKIIALGQGGFYECFINQVNLDAITGGEKLNLCGETTLREAMQIIRHSRLVIGVDTGLGHIACALDKDNIILVGGGHPGRFFPYHHKTLLVRKEMVCYGCDWKCTMEKKIACMTIPDATIKEKIALKLMAS